MSNRGTLADVEYLLDRTVAPSDEPVTLEEAAKQCELQTGTDHDSHLKRLIETARVVVERDSSLCFMPQTCTLRLSDWPDDEEIDLQFHPVYSISSVVYFDENNTSTTWATTNYELKTTRYRSLLVLSDITAATPNLSSTKKYPITITLLCGVSATTYTTATTQRPQVPAPAKAAMLLLIAHWFESRTPVGTVSHDIAFTYDALLQSIRPARIP